MKKVLGIAIGVCLIATLGVLIGCGQQTPSIDTSISQPSGLAIKGVVYTETLNGTRGDPIQGATVSLGGDSANQTTVTNANGEFVFSGIPDGDYILVTTAEGHTRDITSVVIKPWDNVPADNTITVADIQLNSNPIILSYSPVPNSVIGQTPTFVITFNETMDTSTVVPYLYPNEIRIYASADTLPLAVEWVDNKTLIITPEAELVPNEVYTLGINSLYARDTAGFLLTTSSIIDQALEAAQDYRVTSGGAPGAPSGLSIVYDDGITTKLFTPEATDKVDYIDIISMGTNDYLKLYWDPPSSGGVVTGYLLYAALGSNSNYAATEPIPYNNISISVDDLIRILIDQFGSPRDPVTTGDYPLINERVYFKVVAFNGDGESSASSAVSAIDVTGPQIDQSTYWMHGNPAVDTLMDNNYYLPSIDIADLRTIYIGLSEPVDASTISATNFSITAGDGTSVTNATLMTQSSTPLTNFGGGVDVFAIVKIETETDMSNLTVITMGTGVTDLAGNPVVSGTNDSIILIGF